MVAQANKRGKSKNTTNEKKIMTVPLYTQKLCSIEFTIFTTNTNT